MTSAREVGLAGWSIEAQPFLKAILDCVAQPVWVVDHAGMIRFANPAALAALGYDDLSGLDGKPSHETIHYKHPDGSHYPAEDCPMLRPRTTGETVHSNLDWFFRRDGTMFPVSFWSAPIDAPEGMGAVVAFNDIEEQRTAERVRLERDLAQARAGEARAAQRRVIEAADAARRQVTRDLHDGAQHKLMNLVLSLQLIKETIRSDPARTLDLLESSTAQAREAIQDLRELSAGMHPTLLVTHGLRAAVEELADQSPLPVRVEIPETRLPAEIETSLYFLVAEGLTNAAKHARASTAGVRLTPIQDGVLVEVSDDGIGGAGAHGGGSGLAGLADRVSALDGTWSIESPRGAGTVIKAEIPLSPGGP